MFIIYIYIYCIIYLYIIYIYYILYIYIYIYMCIIFFVYVKICKSFKGLSSFPCDFPLSHIRAYGQHNDYVYLCILWYRVEDTCSIQCYILAYRCILPKCWWLGFWVWTKSFMVNVCSPSWSHGLHRLQRVSVFDWIQLHEASLPTTARNLTQLFNGCYKPALTKNVV